MAVLAWLPEARPEQIRRLQVNALSSDAPAFLVRPERVGQQSSAAPLRLRREVPNGVNPGAGVHVGGNAQAWAASCAAMLSFLREQLK